jgi:hypothetical protein
MGLKALLERESGNAIKRLAKLNYIVLSDFAEWKTPCNALQRMVSVCERGQNLPATCSRKYHWNAELLCGLAQSESMQCNESENPTRQFAGRTIVEDASNRTGWFAFVRLIMIVPFTSGFFAASLFLKEWALIINLSNHIEKQLLKVSWIAVSIQHMLTRGTRKSWWSYFGSAHFTVYRI